MSDSYKTVNSPNAGKEGGVTSPILEGSPEWRDAAGNLDAPALTLTVLTSRRPDTITKQYDLGADGALVKYKGKDKDKAGSTWAGSVKREVVQGLAELGDLLAGLRPAQAGIFGVPIGHEEVRYVTKKMLAEHPGYITRAREHFEFTTEPGFMLLDCDADKIGGLSFDEFRARLFEAVPELADAPMLIRASASSGIVRSGTGEVLHSPTRGLHTLLPVMDARLIPAAGKAIVARLKAHQDAHPAQPGRWAWIGTTTSGARQENSLIDASVWKPEHLSFEAPAVLGAGLERKVPPQAIYGDPAGLFDLSILQPAEAMVPPPSLVSGVAGMDEDEGPPSLITGAMASLMSPEQIALQVPDVRSALEHLSADCSREEWVGIGQSLKGLGDAGRALWMSWSATSTMFNEAEALAKWESFTGDRTSFRSIFARAQAAGWVNPRSKAGKALAFTEVARAAIEQAKTDRGAVFEAEALAAFSFIKATDLGEWARLRGDLKKAGVPLREFDKAMADHARAVVREYRAAQPAGEGIEAQLRRGEGGRVMATVANVMAALSDPDYLGVRVRADEFTNTTQISFLAAGAEDWRTLQPEDITLMRVLLDTKGWYSVPRDMMTEACALHAKATQADSAQEWLNRIAGKWDGVARVETFAQAYLGCEDSPYHRAVARYLWTALAGRVLDPGCKADMVPVLVGKQGARKSSAVAALAPHPSAFGEVDLGKKDDDRARLLTGKVAAELPELRGLRQSDVRDLKAWVAKTEDKWIPKYRETERAQPRRFVLFGTTNEMEFLPNDSTGQRRWLPVVVGDRIDTDAIARDRDQLWAEAAQVFVACGGVLWREAEELAKAVHAQHETEDAWADTVREWLLVAEPMTEEGEPTRRVDLPFLMVDDVLKGAIHLPPAQFNPGTKKRMRDLLQQLGYVNDSKWDPQEKKVKRAWWRGDGVLQAVGG